MESTTPAHPVVTSDDQSLVLLIVVLFLMVVSIIAVLSKMAITVGMTRTITPTEWIVASAMTFGIAQSVAVALATKSGLGKKENLLNATEASNVAKALYASDYFYFLAIGTCKVSVLLFIRRLAADKLYKQGCFYTICYVSVWTMVAVITLALRCGSHAPWNTRLESGACINTKAFWIAIWFFDMLSELVILVLPIFMMKPVRVPLSKKIFVISVFFCRITYVIASIVRLVFLPNSAQSSNFTFEDINPVITTQIVLCVSIVTACIPSLKPLLEAFNSGQMAINVKGANGYYGSGSNQKSAQHYVMDKVSTTHSTTQSANRSQRGPAELVGDELNSSRGRRTEKQSKNYHSHGNSITASRRTTSQDDDAASIASQQSETMIIKKDIAWTVRYEDGTVQQGR